MLRRRPKTSAALLAAALALGALYLDWGPARAPALATSAVVRLDRGPLRVGYGKAALEPKLPATVAGFGPPRRTVGRASPLFVRAVVLADDQARLAILSFDLLEAPAALVGKIRERARGLDVAGVVVTATHAHSSVGGFDPSLLAQVIGTGRFEEERLDALADKARAGLEQALGALKPVSRVDVGLAHLSNGVRNRAGSPEVEDAVRTVDFVSGEAAVATLVSFGAHPTLVGRNPDHLDGDFPVAAMARLEEQGLAPLFLQESLGDLTAASDAPEPRAVALGRALADAALRARAGASGGPAEVAWVEATASLPGPDARWLVPAALARPAENVLSRLAPSQVVVGLVRLGPLALLHVGGEPTARAGAALRELAGPSSAVVSLANGYVGYVETAERMRAGTGEARRSYFGPELLGVIEAAARRCVAELSPRHEPPAARGEQ